ncbi:MAG: M36 family metallopeptidase [Saprospiraceae bacterium]|nr:M36 family metallopeptidase [Saprospiraceae bacterium]
MCSRQFVLLLFYFSASVLQGQVSPSVWFSHFESVKNSAPFPNDYGEFVVTHSHKSSLSKINHIYIRQLVRDIPVSDGNMSLHINQNGELVAKHDQFIKNLTQKISLDVPVLTIEKVLDTMWLQLGKQMTLSNKILSFEDSAVKKTIIDSENKLFGPVLASLTYKLTDDNRLVLAWEIEFESLNGNEHMVVYIDATTGKIVKKQNQVVECSFIPEAKEHSKKPFMPLEMNQMNMQYLYNVYPLKVESPIHGDRSLINNPADINASPYNWHDVNGQQGNDYTETIGNNVEAREDIDGNNATLGQMANGGNDLVFNFPINFGAHPNSNQNAAITNLFYWNNVIHDIIYQYGFDEQSGNFQTNNYGNGGLANDHVFADAMDGEGLNNANFMTPADGSNPRMQMFLWNNGSFLVANSPAPIAGLYQHEKASFGPSAFNLSGNVVLGQDNSNAPSLGCLPLINGNQIVGRIALLDRGGCEESLKCLNAQNAGAIAVIVCHTQPGNPYVMPFGTYGNSINIPCIMVSKQVCDSIKLYLPLQVNVSMIGSGFIDSDFDNGVICHEYGHGISNRLTGGADVVNCLFNQEQMGEGWSDWYGLMLTMDEDDNEERARGIGSYSMGQFPDGIGLRPYRYSTDMVENPHTYNSIKQSAIPHGVGSVWCAMLWELTWAFIREYGYDPDFYYGTGGNNKILQIVTEALKLQPCNPGFVDGRDAILLADQQLFSGQHQCLIWKAFAKRGLGASASQGSSADVQDGNEAFDMPRSCCSYVSNINNAGNGSLREAVACTNSGGTIHFLNFIMFDTIELTGQTIILNKNLTIKHPSTWSLGIQAFGEFPVFENSGNVTLENLHLIGNLGIGTRVLSNSGNMVLKSVKLSDILTSNANGQSVLNTGTLSIEGQTIIDKP